MNERMRTRPNMNEVHFIWEKESNGQRQHFQNKICGQNDKMSTRKPFITYLQMAIFATHALREAHSCPGNNGILFLIIKEIVRFHIEITIEIFDIQFAYESEQMNSHFI